MRRRYAGTHLAATAALVAAVLALGLTVADGALTGPARAEAAAGCGPGERTVLAPPAKGLYHAAYPNFSNARLNESAVSVERIRAFERLAGKPITWAYFSNHWFGGRIVFPAAAVRTIQRAGRVPFIRMMAWSRYFADEPDPVFTMQRIIGGDFDDALRRWARDAKATATPVLVEFGTEVNGEWFPWNGRWNGGGRTDGYGDPSWPDGPERFRDAYRHIVDLFRAEDVRNVTWFFHVNAGSFPHARWNRIRYYYPGDDYVDWVGISNYGSVSPEYEWDAFTPTLRSIYAQVERMTAEKPVAVLEYGVVEDAAHGDKAQWIRAAFRGLLSGEFPRLYAASWWQERWENEPPVGPSDVRINSSPEALAAYRAGVAGPTFVSTPRFECR